jgi:hypothetical protein
VHYQRLSVKSDSASHEKIKYIWLAYICDFLVPLPIGFSAQVLITEPWAEQRASCGHLSVAGFGWLSLPDGSAWRGRRNTNYPSSG